MVGDSTMGSKSVFLERVLRVGTSCTAGNGTCFISARSRLSQPPSACPSLRGRLQRRDFDVLLFNAGLHFLSPHYSPRTSFAEYWQLLRECAASLQKTFRGAQPIYILTNRICESAWRGRFAHDLPYLRDNTESASYSMQWSDVGVQSLRVAEYAMASELGWRLLDSNSLNHCACTGERDGRHFWPLDPQLVVRLAQLINSKPVALQSRPPHQLPRPVITAANLL